MANFLGGLLGGVAGGATVAIVIKAVDEFSNTFKQAEKGMGGLAGTITSNMGKITAATAAATAVVGLMAKFAYDAAGAMDVQEQFNKIVGEEGPRMLQLMDQALLGTVDKYKLMATASSAVNKGIQTENLPIMAQYAQRLADMDPQFADVTASMNDLSTAIATGRTMTLARMGIDIDAQAIYEQTALKLGLVEISEKAVKGATDETTLSQKILTDQLTDQQKAMALQDAIMGAITEKMKGMATPTADFADKTKELAARMTELKIELGKAVLPIFEKIIDLIRPLIMWFNGLSDSTKKMIAVGVLLTAGLIALVGAIIMVNVALWALSANPIVLIIGLIIAAVAGLVIGLKYLYDHCKIVRDIFDIIGGLLKLSLLPLFLLFKLAVEAVKIAFEWLADKLKPIIDFIAKIIEGIKMLVDWLNKVTFGAFSKGADDIKKTNEALDDTSTKTKKATKSYEDYDSVVTSSTKTTKAATTKKKSTVNQKEMDDFTKRQREGKYDYIDEQGREVYVSPYVIKLNDFILKGNKLYRTNPMDTIFGIKDMPINPVANPIAKSADAGNTFVFYIDSISGMDVDEMMVAFQRQLNRMVRV